MSMTERRRCKPELDSLETAQGADTDRSSDSLLDWSIWVTMETKYRVVAPAQTLVF
jgi:hypothetical protein